MELSTAFSSGYVQMGRIYDKFKHAYRMALQEIERPQYVSGQFADDIRQKLLLTKASDIRRLLQVLSKVESDPRTAYLARLQGDVNASCQVDHQHSPRTLPTY